MTFTFTVKKTFGQEWAAMLWRIMSNTGKGYKKPSMKRTGKGEDKRADKVGVPSLYRRYNKRYSVS